MAHLKHNVKAARYIMLILTSGIAAGSVGCQKVLDLTSTGVLHNEEVKA